MQSVRVALVMLLLATACGGEPDDERLPPETEESGVMADDDEEVADAARAAQTDASVPAVDALDAQLAATPDASGSDGRAAVEAGRKPADAGPRFVDARAVSDNTQDAANTRREAGVLRRDAAVDASDGTRRDAAVQDAAVVCTAEGHLSYSLTRVASPTPEQNAAYMRITRAMDTAVQKYNCYADITRNLQIAYDPMVAGGAEGRANGTIRFGSQMSMNFVRAMHEISHALGVGSTEFRMRVANQIFTGPEATAVVRAITGDPRAVLTSDGSHFSPYGLSTDDEYRGEQDAAHHCAIVEAIRSDLGL